MKKSILLLFSLCLMLQVLAQKKGYIIKIDGETIYTDLGSSFVQVGDWINVYGKGTYIVHPVTQKKIYTEPEIIGKLEIGSTFKDYSIAKVNDRSLLHLLKEGLEVFVISNDKIIGQSGNTSLSPMQSAASSERIPIVIAPAQVNDVVGVGHFGGYVADI